MMAAAPGVVASSPVQKGADDLEQLLGSGTRHPEQQPSSRDHFPCSGSLSSVLGMRPESTNLVWSRAAGGTHGRGSASYE